MMDVGNPGYQAAWLSNVLSGLRAGGWDGVFMDDTNADMGWHLGGRTIARYPTAAAWRSATRSMLSRVGPALISAGFLAVPNLSTPWAADYDAQATWSDWLRFTSGAAQEYYGKWGMGSSGWFAGNDWTYRQRFQDAHRAGGQDLPRHHLRAPRRRADDDLGARRTSCSSTSRPTAARSSSSSPIPRRRIRTRRPGPPTSALRSERGSRSARPGGATSRTGRCS